MRVLVCGGRRFSDMSRICEVLNAHAVSEHGPIDIIIHGGASGADELARIYAGVTFTPDLVFLADWARHGKRAGPLRNQRMLDDGKPDLVVAFPGGRGTADMIKRAQKAGVRVDVVPA